MLIFQFSLYPTHHHLHARGVFNSFFFVITLNLTTITLRPVKRENQLNSHFLLHRLPFYVFFFSRLFIHHLVGSVLGHFFLGAFDCITFFFPRLCVCTFGSATATTIRWGSLTFSHSPRIRSNQKRWEEQEKESERVTSQGYPETMIICYLTSSARRCLSSASDASRKKVLAWTEARRELGHSPLVSDFSRSAPVSSFAHKLSLSKSTNFLFSYSQANKIGLAPFFCHNGDHLTTPPPAHCGIPAYQLDPKTMGEFCEHNFSLP